ncbi:MAG: ATP-binding protein [Bryobacteraceae bacterium]
MTFRTRLLLVIAITVVAAVTVVGWVVLATTRRAFERAEEQRIGALVAQFRREFARRGDEVARRVEGIASSDAALTIAIAPDYSLYVEEARALARAHNLDFLELVAGDGSIVSSAEWPARFGYKQDWLLESSNWNTQAAFLKRQELPDETVLGLMAVRLVSAADRKLYVAGGEQLDREFLRSLSLPAGLRLLLYRDLSRDFSPRLVTDAEGPVAGAGKLAPVIDRVRRQGRELTATVNWTGEPAGAETFHAFPLTGRNGQFLGALLIGSSRRDLVQLERFLLRTALVVGFAGVLIGVLLGWWATARVTRPVKELAAGAHEIARGKWDQHVPVRSGDEIGQLALAFNQMTRQLLEQRDKLVQTERVAAWRELARRLAHELKNPLFPLQITVENMQRARELHPEQFDEVFQEGAQTLLAELANLRQIIARFSDFAKMPRPELRQLDLNATVRDAMRLFEAQLANSPVTLALELDPGVPPVTADPEQLGRALQNLVLNAIDAMPEGGAITIRTLPHEGGARIEVADTGQGLTPEECERLFTPYYTTKQHGTGLGLAIVQSVVSDHGGRISVESQPGRGATFRIDL